MLYPNFQVRELILHFNSLLHVLSQQSMQKWQICTIHETSIIMEWPMVWSCFLKMVAIKWLHCICTCSCFTQLCEWPFICKCNLFTIVGRQEISKWCVKYCSKYQNTYKMPTTVKNTISVQLGTKASGKGACFQNCVDKQQVS